MMKRFIAVLLAMQLVLPLHLTGILVQAAEQTLVSTAAELANAVKTEGEYRIGADFGIDKLTISKNVTLDGDGHTLSSANSAGTWDRRRLPMRLTG